MNKKMLSGSFWLSFGSIFSKAIGVAYLIPWLAMMGSKQNINATQALFNSTYSIYAIFLSLGMAGFPSGIARRIAMFNSNNEFKKSKKLFKVSLLLMGISGIVFALILYIFAPFFAKNSPIVSQKNAVMAIRFITPAVAIIPSMSIIRGWFQGNQDLLPFGVSQIWEQIFRIAFTLIATYLLIFKLNQNYVIAVYYSVFAAFIGAIASYIYLLVHYKNKVPVYREQEKVSKTANIGNIKHMLLMICYESIPFVFVGAGINLCQLIDQLFFKQIMINLLDKSAEFTQYIFTIFSANPSKITSVVIALGTAIAETSLPMLAEKKAGNDFEGIQKLLKQNYSYLLFVLLPVATILSSLSPEINGIFFFFDQHGSWFMFMNIWQSVVMTIALNGLTLLQSLRYSRRAMLYLFVGIMVKIILQFPLVYLFQGAGAIIATFIAFSIVAILSYGKLKKEFNVKLKGLVPNLIINFLFFELAMFLEILMAQIYIPSTKFPSFLYCVIFGTLLLVSYLLLAKKTGVLDSVFK